jgi:hypothetical protein
MATGYDNDCKTFGKIGKGQRMAWWLVMMRAWEEVEIWEKGSEFIFDSTWSEIM